MKKSFLIAAILLCGVVFGQQTEQVERDGFESESANKDYKDFTAENGAIVRKEYVILEDLKLAKGFFGYRLATSIEKVVIGDYTRLYYNITSYAALGTSGYLKNYQAHIPVDHLGEILDALDVLLAQSGEDRKIGTKKFNNYFRTKNDFEIGYNTIPNKKEVVVEWYITLERYGLQYVFEFWQEEQFYKAVQSMKTAYEALKNSQ